MNGRVVISIDFDFFVPEDTDWDFGHQESELFLNFLWKTRLQFKDQAVTDGQELVFWDWLKSWADPSMALLFVSDSHAWAWKVACDCDHLVLVDQHHDMWETQERNHIACHTWVRQWLVCDPTRQVTWIKPDHSKFSVPDDLLERVEVVRWSDAKVWATKHQIEPQSIHVCRSGCWVPPWLDQAFINFVRAIEPETYTEEVDVLQDGVWDAMTERWSESDYTEAQALLDQMRALMSDRSKR